MTLLKKKCILIRSRASERMMNEGERGEARNTAGEDVKSMPVYEWTSCPSRESCLSNCLALMKVVEP